jgi:hypothetical protein
MSHRYEDHRLRVFENRKPIKLFGPKEEKIAGRKGMYSMGFIILTHKLLITD